LKHTPVLLVAAFWSLSSLATAQPAGEPNPPPAAASPDVVILKAGGVVRGTTSLPRGTYRLALSYDRGRPIETEAPVVVEGDSRLSGTYTSKSNTRWLGVAIAPGAGTAGLALSFSGLSEEEEGCGKYGCHTSTGTNEAKMWGGLGIMLAGLE